MKTVIYEEERTQSVLSTLGTPTIINKGDIVVLTIVHSHEAAAVAYRRHMQQLPEASKTDG